VRQHTYRIYQEALTNALKYSPPGSLIVVGLRLAPLLELTVTNEVDSAFPGSRAGQGLRNLRQRAALLRAELTAGPVPGGWQVRLLV
jgi:signal transduction histidine kinase